VVEPIRRVGYRILFGFLWDSKVGEKFDLEVRCAKEKINEVILLREFRKEKGCGWKIFLRLTAFCKISIYRKVGIGYPLKIRDFLNIRRDSEQEFLTL
jgi:hypothetical protein